MGGALKAWNLLEKRWHVWGQVDFNYPSILVAMPHHRTLGVQVGSTSLRLWDLDKDQWRGEAVQYPFALGCLSVAPDGQTMAVGGIDGSLWLTQGFSAQARARLAGNTGGVQAVSFSPDGRTLASCDERRVRLWHVRTGLELFSFEVPGGFVRALAFSPDGKVLAVVGRPQPGGTNVWLWYAATERGN
jgi:WD40 repeat protein